MRIISQKRGKLFYIIKQIKLQFVRSIVMEGQKKIEKYQFSLKKMLGQGSYANVYLGKQIQTSQPVAVKVIDKKIFSNAYNVKNIQSEIDIMKKVSHQNIVKLYDIYQTLNNMYIVTELCQDGDLYRLLQKRKKLSENEAKAFLKDIMNGAKYLHKNGIIHRDLKPANILIKQGVCKLSDFGFAKSLNHDQTIMKSIVGTPLYMSPQILKKAKYTNKSDLWSIGLIYYEMLHGRTPWPAQNQLQLINGIYHKKVVFASDVSQKSKDFIKRCLEIYEDDRISWEEAFNHRLLADQPIKMTTKPNLQITKYSSSFEDKENVGTHLNKMKTPSGKVSQKQKKSPLVVFKANKNAQNTSNKKPDQTCLTPKGRQTPKGKTNLSNLKPKSDISIKKQKQLDNNQTIKKKIKKELTQISHLQQNSTKKL